MPIHVCPICKGEANREDHRCRGDHHWFDCPRCGNYEIGGSFAAVRDHQEHPLPLLSGVIRRSHELHEPLPMLTRWNVEELQGRAPTRDDERARHLLEAIERRGTGRGKIITLDKRIDYPLVYGVDSGELRYFLEYLEEQGWANQIGETYGCLSCKITPKGRRVLEAEARLDDNLSPSTASDEPSTSHTTPDAFASYSNETGWMLFREDSETTMQWDLFISHAHEDKKDVAEPLAAMFKERGLNVWYDKFTLKIGDSLSRSIDQGLARSHFGLVILSPHFFKKHWPQKELNGLAALETGKNKKILPMWHNVDHKEVAEYSPTLADILGIPTTEGLHHIVEQVMAVVRPADNASPDPAESSRDGKDSRIIINVSSWNFRYLDNVDGNLTEVPLM
jgi:hypothetical protein